MENTQASAGKTPWHIWVVGVLGVLWNGSGALTITMAQLEKLPNLTADEIAYYAAQPGWFQLMANIATYGALFAGVALLCRSRFAVWLYGMSLVFIFLTDIIDLAMGTSRALANTPAAVVTGLIFVIACLQLYYTWRMGHKGLLK